MQQTEKYKLNLIESSDPFLPDALNANTQRVEDVLVERMEGSLDAMDTRVTVLEGRKFACGTYKGDGKFPHFIPLPFTPKVVMVKMTANGAAGSDAIGAAPETGMDEHPSLKVVESCFNLVDYYGYHLNAINTYAYIAFN